ncbi:hypothetical protein ACFLQN_03350 [Candidatus Aenigmatarchaeota archaeon]
MSRKRKKGFPGGRGKREIHSMSRTDRRLSDRLVSGNEYSPLGVYDHSEITGKHSSSSTTYFWFNDRGVVGRYTASQVIAEIGKKLGI